jgi:hypothetical protein
VPRPASTWKLDRFLDRLDAWIEQEVPKDDLPLIVAIWIMTRYETPYAGVRRAEGFDNLWYGVVPGSIDGDGRVVVCSYWIKESEKVVTCDSFATLSPPI